VSELTIAVATGPSGGLSLENEIRLVKPALLYADRVTLISPVATLLRAAEDVGASESLTMALFRQLGPTLDPKVADAFAHFDELRRKRWPSPSERKQISEFRKIVVGGSDELLEQARAMMVQAGADELAPAMDAGLVVIDPVVQEPDPATTLMPAIAKAAGFDSEYDSLLANSFMERIQELLADPFAYPLFDAQVGDIVRAHVSEGLFEVGAMPRRHGRQVSAAAQLMEKLPSFPSASMHELLDIREELRQPLTKFRAAVAEMERTLQPAAYEPDFSAEVEDLYLEKVAPALQEIAGLVRRNSYLRELMRVGVGDAKSLLTAVLTVGVAALAGVPDLVAAALAAGVPSGAASLRAALATGAAKRDIEAHHLFFLYKTEELLVPD